MTRKEAEDVIFASYMKASAHHAYEDRDRNIRHPEITRDWIRSMAGTDTVVVTGSKGKGSVANMVSAILSAFLQVGLMTSPHLVSFNERFRVNGETITDEDFTATVEILAPAIAEMEAGLPEDVGISPMGIETAMALTWFKKKQTDLNILECGKGARYDDVNNASHAYAIINGIFLEHTRELGSTLEEIAEDKSHVIQPGMKAAFSMEQEAGVLAVLEQRAKECHVPLYVYGRDFAAENVVFSMQGMTFDVVVCIPEKMQQEAQQQEEGQGEKRIPAQRFEQLRIPLLGSHQAKNCALAMAFCVEYAMERAGHTDVETAECEMASGTGAGQTVSWSREAMEQIRANLRHLRWPGRMEILSLQPFMMLDACINVANVAPVAEVLDQLDIHDYVAIVGIPEDKDYLGVARALWKRKTSASGQVDLILTKSQNPYYHFSKGQVERLVEEGIPAKWTESLQEAVTLARTYDKPIIILGTTSLVGEFEKYRNEILRER